LADEGELSDEVRLALIQGTISEQHGELLSQLPTDKQTQTLLIIINRKLSLEETKTLIQAMQNDASKEDSDSTDAFPDPEIKAIEHSFEQALGTRVKLHNGRRGGRLVIYYYSDEEFQTLYDRLVGEEL
jgi:ParB family chromosome partitioning protein